MSTPKPRNTLANKAFQLLRAGKNAYMKECVQVQWNQLCNICTYSKYVYITYYKSTKTKWKTKNIKYIFTQYHSRHDMWLKILESIILNPDKSLLDSPYT